MPKKVTKSQLAKEMIEEFTKDGKCTLSKKKLGELLHYRYPSEFKSADAARSAVRNITNAKGDPARKAVGLRVEWKGFDLPKQEAHDYSKMIVNEKRIGILSDIHFPYADLDALNIATRHLIEYKPDCIILNGDAIDAYQLSRFERDPRKRSFKYELDMLKNFVEQLRNKFPNTRIIFRTGNHEARYESYILARVPELIDLELFTFDNVIRARELGIDYLSGKRLIKCGHVNIAHGHEFAGGATSPVNPARGYYMKAKCNIIAGHNHQTSEHISSDINGNVIGAWSVACLSEIHPHYMPINNWNTGFATLDVFGEEFSVRNYKIIKGKVV
jgi:predicted phosphodiesterase